MSRTWVAVAGLVAMMLCGCTGTSHNGSLPSGRTTSVTSQLSYDQALAQVHDYAQQATGAFPAGTTLTFREENAAPCSNSDNPPPGTPVNIASYYWVAGISADDNAKYLDQFVHYWKAPDWRLARDDRPGTQLVMMENSSGFSVILQLTADGSRASITATSPCVPPKQTAGPSS